MKKVQLARMDAQQPSEFAAELRLKNSDGKM